MAAALRLLALDVQVPVEVVGQAGVVAGSLDQKGGEALAVVRGGRGRPRGGAGRRPREGHGVRGQGGGARAAARHGLLGTLAVQAAHHRGLGLRLRHNKAEGFIF